MLKKKVVKKTHLDKNWNCLSSLKGYFETSKVEKVKEFTGYELTTNKGKYSLCDGTLSFESIKGKSKKLDK